jgi:hypothetical protein
MGSLLPHDPRRLCVAGDGIHWRARPEIQTGVYPSLQYARIAVASPAGAAVAIGCIH